MGVEKVSEKVWKGRRTFSINSMRNGCCFMQLLIGVGPAKFYEKL